MNSLTMYRPTSSKYLTPTRLEVLRAKGWSDAKIANLHRMVFSRAGPQSIMNMVSSDKWIKLPQTKLWYVQVLGMYTSKEYDEKYGVQS